MKETFRLVAVLTVFCLGAGLLLAWTNNVTAKPIREAREAETKEALKRVLPDCDNDVVQDARRVSDNGKEWTFYIARRQGAYVGAAFKSASAKGYGGAIEVLVGMQPDGKINGIEILRADGETPGLGAKVKEPKFLSQFKGLMPESRWAVTKDGGEIQGITGATISSRAVTEAVKAGMEVYRNHAAELAAP